MLDTRKGRSINNRNNWTNTEFLKQMQNHTKKFIKKNHTKYYFINTTNISPNKVKTL